MREIFEKIVTVFVISLYMLLNFLLNVFKFSLFWQKKIPKDIKKILIFKIGNIGDTICAVPSIVSIRKNFPKAKIVLVSSPGRYGAIGVKELLEDAEFLDGLTVYYQEDIKTLKGKINLIKKLRNGKFDLFAELPNNLSKFRTEIRNIIFAKLIGAKYAFGFRITTVHIFKKIQSRYLKFDNEVKRLLKVLKKDGLRVDKISFPLPVLEKDKKFVNDFLTELNNNKLIAINPNAKRQTNLWPLERFAEVGRWITEHKKTKILITGGKDDKGRTSKLKEMIGKEADNVSNRFNLLQTSELLKHCQLLISNDTGTIHMAAAVGTPIIGIYSARDFKNKWSPYGEENIVLRKEPKCHTCFSERCQHLTCLKMITVEHVKEAVKKITDNL